jgi:hypothetical protein
MFVCEDLLRLWCDRLHAASKAGAGQGATEMPFELHRDAEVVAEYHLDWPTAAKDKLTGVSADGLKIHYVRTLQRARASVVQGFYERKMDSPEVHSLADGGWLETCGPLPNAGWHRSVDMLFTTTEDLSQKRVADEIDWTIQLLVIDIKTPLTAAAAN